MLLLGPLYHPVDRPDRVRALTDARRMVRPGDVVLAALISRWAPMFEGMLHGLPRVHRDVAGRPDQRHQGLPYGFTTAYFHRPDEVAVEFAGAGLELTDLLAIEGMAQWIPDLAARLSDSDKRALLLELIARTEREPAILGATAHVLAAGS